MVPSRVATSVRAWRARWSIRAGVHQGCHHWTKASRIVAVVVLLRDELQIDVLAEDAPQLEFAPGVPELFTVLPAPHRVGQLVEHFVDRGAPVGPVALEVPVLLDMGGV